MLNIKLRLRALTPIHIGTGEVYEAIRFVIDNEFLYEFDEFEFYKNLGEESKKIFNKLSLSDKYDAAFELALFVKEHKADAIRAKKYSVPTFPSIRDKYDQNIGKAVSIQDENEMRKIFNQFKIAKTIRNANDNRIYIPGSSLKGAISTALRETVYKKSGKDEIELDNQFSPKNPSNSIMKNLSIADSTTLKSREAIGYSHNIPIFKKIEEYSRTLKNMIEVICENSSFETSITFKDLEPEPTFNMDDLIKSCNEHYLENFKSMFRQKDSEIKQYSCDCFTKEFINNYSNFKPKNKQFLIRVGKHSGGRAVTIDGMRKIMVRVGKYNFKELDHETTTWMFGKNNKKKSLLPFGWLLCEIVE